MLTPMMFRYLMNRRKTILFNKILNDTIKKAELLSPQKPCDYIGDDGFLHCGICHAPKRGRTVTKSGTAFVHKVNCLCDLEKIEQDRETKAKEALILKRKQNRDCAFSDKTTRHFTFEVDDRNNAQASNLARGYAASFDPKTSKGLLFYGGCGTGKSFYAACIVNAVIDRNYTAKFTSISEIEAELWAADEKKAVYDYFNGFDLLVLDDFSAERDTQYMQEIAFNIIDRRFKSGKPLIVTTNLTPAEIAEPKSMEQKRVLSRIIGSCTSYVLRGTDKRTENRKTDNSAECDKLLHYPLPENLK